jgi:S1-C subfamily serine protease
VATTDADGALRLDGVLPGAPVELQLDAAGFVPHRRTVRPPIGREVFELGAIPLLPEKPLEPVMGRVGLVLTMNDDGGVAVRTAVEALPANKAGIRAGDLILAVDGLDTKNADLGTVVTMVGGRPNTPVLIDVRSPGGPVRHLRVVRM